MKLYHANNVNKESRLASDNLLVFSLIKLELIKSVHVVLLDFSLTVKAATLVFISGCGSAISSAKENQVLFIIW